MKALQRVWFVGDNFTACMYCSHFLFQNHPKQASFIKTNFDFEAHCNSRFNSANQNMILRLQNTLAGAFNKYKDLPLPKYILVVLDDDLITFIDYKSTGVTDLLAKWINWLIAEFQDLIDKKKKSLPAKAKCAEQPCVYWCAAPLHNNFNHQHNDLRRKLNTCMELIFKGNKNGMRLVKLKNRWDTADSSLVCNDKITDKGLDTYWNAIDASFKFNLQKHKLFLAKNAINSATKTVTGKETHSEDKSHGQFLPREHDIPRFFKRHSSDQYHWHSRSAREDHHRHQSRYFLPRLGR